jgi:hypothetical protein
MSYALGAVTLRDARHVVDARDPRSAALDAAAVSTSFTTTGFQA